MWLIHEKIRGRKSRATVPFKSSEKQKNKNIDIISSNSMDKYEPKIVEVKGSRCGLKVVYFRKNCDCRNAKLWLRTNISLKSCEIAIAEVLLQIVELRLRTQKKRARAHLWLS
jgi:hypothetical protein